MQYTKYFAILTKENGQPNLNTEQFRRMMNIVSVEGVINGMNRIKEEYKDTKYCTPKTLDGTDNDKWIVYFPKGDLTIVLNKKTNKFENICAGKYSNLKYDVTFELSKIIGKKMKYRDYDRIVSSIRYGSSKMLGTTNCINKDCVEYHHKGDFTTLAFFEFNDKGDFVILKKIAIGKVPELKEY